MFFQTTTYALSGLRVHKIKVEVDVEDGRKALAIQGLPTGATDQARELLRSAIVHAGFSFPDDSRVKVRIAPMPLLLSEVQGLSFAVTAAILVATGQVSPASIGRIALGGNLQADGTIAPIRGALQMAEAVAEDRDLDCLAIASASAPEAACASGVEVLQLHTLGAVRYLQSDDRRRLHPEPRHLPASPEPGGLDFRDLRGIDAPRRAAEVAVAGDHSLLLAAPAGTGQSLVAHRIPSILPPLRRAEALELLRIAGAVEDQSRSEPTGRPFRSLSPRAPLAAIVGGGNPLTPGEVTCAHNGVLYVDQVVTFDLEILDALTTARRSRSTLVGSPPQVCPSAFFLVASTPLCPCGSFAAPDRLCSCDEPALARYQRRLAVVADSFDMVSRYGPPTQEGPTEKPGEPSCSIRLRVMEARARQAARLGDGRTNQSMSADETEDCGLTPEAVDAINRGLPYPHLAGRRLRIAKVARTIADLAGADLVDTFHIAEALDFQIGPPPSSATRGDRPLHTTITVPPMDPATAPGSHS